MSLNESTEILGSAILNSHLQSPPSFFFLSFSFPVAAIEQEKQAGES